MGRNPPLLILAGAITLLTLTPPSPAAADPLRRARALVQKGRHSEAFKLLNKAHVELRGQLSRYAAVLLALASFYERQAGDFDEARRYYEELTRLGLPPRHAGVQQARQSLQRLRAQAVRYKKANETLLSLSLERFEKEVARQRVKALRAFIARDPGYPRVASAYYYLGKNLLLLERRREALRAFDRALALRPALGFHLPVEHGRDTVYLKLLRQDLALAARVVLALWGGLVLLLLLWSRPWRTLGLRQGVMLGLLLGSWWAFFRLAVWITGTTVGRKPGVFAEPLYLFTAPGSPLAGVLDTLFVYGLVGVGGVFVMTVATSRMRLRWTRASFNGLAALLLLSSLMALFYLQHASQGLFKQGPPGSYRYLRGDFYYAKQQQAPFILTDPMAYCRFQQTIGELDEEQIKRWFRRHARLCAGRQGRP